MLELGLSKVPWEAAEVMAEVMETMATAGVLMVLATVETTQLRAVVGRHQKP